MRLAPPPGNMGLQQNKARADETANKNTPIILGTVFAWLLYLQRSIYVNTDPIRNLAKRCYSTLYR